MRAAGTPIELWRSADGSYVSAVLIDGLMEHHLIDWEAQWFPQLRDSYITVRDRCKANGEVDHASIDFALGLHHLQDAPWNWRKKHRKRRARMASRSFAIELDGQTQGMSYVDLVGHQARLNPDKGKDLVYVEYVATAPWNRPIHGQVPRYRGVGPILLAAAISVSVDEEMHGRIGLHALPQAVAFYEAKMGMTNLGPDPAKQGLSYFEFTAEDAAEFIAR